jgi:porin
MPTSTVFHRAALKVASPLALAAAFGAAFFLAAPAHADDAGNGLWQRSTLLGDIGGLRPALAAHGITFSLSETSEYLANTMGGLKRGGTYDGLTTMGLQIDTGKAFGWTGGTFNASALQIHGRNLSPDYLDNIQTASGIEAKRTTRLWELWFDQAFLGGKADVKLGQQSIDQEFMTSSNSALFVNTMMGWPTIPSDDLYGGGPAYPLSSLGVRVQAKPTDALTLLAGVYNDNPGGGAFSDDAQALDADGAKFNFGTGVLSIAEAQYATTIKSLPGTYKLGFWYDSARFPDQEIGTDGLSLANPASNGESALREGNHSFYAVADQMLWQPTANGPRSLNAFLRVMTAPNDRNLVSFSANGGLTLKDPLPSRDNDTAGIGFGVAKVSDSAAAFARDENSFGTPVPVPGTESFIEATYQFQAAPWWQIQPDLQYVMNPGGGENDANGQLVKDELVIGVRTNIAF